MLENAGVKDVKCQKRSDDEPAEHGHNSDDSDTDNNYNPPTVKLFKSLT